MRFFRAEGGAQAAFKAAPGFGGVGRAGLLLAVPTLALPGEAGRFWANGFFKKKIALRRRAEGFVSQR
jgi:hypothetical protein